MHLFIMPVYTWIHPTLIPLYSHLNPTKPCSPTGIQHAHAVGGAAGNILLKYAVSCTFGRPGFQIPRLLNNFIRYDTIQNRQRLCGWNEREPLNVSIYGTRKLQQPIQTMNFIRKHLVSYRYALRGIALAFRHERNMRIHALASLAVLTLNVYFRVSKTEWIITLVLIGLVWMAELFNTALEKLADQVSREQQPLIAQAKDLAAGAVLTSCLAAAACALILYGPYIITLYME